MRFRCKRCGQCCRGGGYVFVEEDEIGPMAAFLGLSREAFVTRYVVEFGPGVLRLAGAMDDPCPFLSGNDCGIHPVKPRQCRTFPWEWRDPGFEDYCPGYEGE